MEAEKELELNLQVVEFLLQCGFSVSNRNNEGKTPLHTASVKVIMIINITTININIDNENKRRRRMRWNARRKSCSRNQTV